jgi:transcriptional regulator with XRE-family HTH domain
MQAGLIGPGVGGVRLSDEADDGLYLRDVGLRIRLHRVSRRVSQDELARRSGLSRVTLGSIERGDHPATVLTYRKLARAFGIPLSELLDERDPRTF